MFKRFTALLLALVLVIGLIPAASAAPETTVDSSEVSIEGTNGFGDLLSEEIAESQEEKAEEAAEYPGGYTVTDLEFDGNVAAVTYDSMEEATLVVALYTEDGMQLVTSATAAVTPDATEATVTFGDDMPEYFLASAYLLDSYDLSPLCAAYDTPMYTREMQELLASTVNDYDPEKVLNLDDDETTNFAVYADSTIVIEAVEGANTVASIDDENATYVIQYADEQITSLTEGDVFVYPYAENEILIVKVASIAVDGTTATITGSELELEEVFSYMKVEGDSDTADMSVDDSTAAEGITYVGLVEEGASTQAWEGGGSVTASHEFDIKIEEKGESDYIDASLSVTGSLNVQLNVSLNYYISLSRQFLEFKADPSLTLGVTIAGNVTGKYPIGDFGVSPVVGVFVGFSPEIQLEYNGTMTLSANVSMTIGVAYSNDKGTENLCTKPKVTFNMSVEGKLFFGIDFCPNAKIISDKVASLKLTTEVGFELTAKMSGTLFEYYESDAESIHSCQSCLGLDIAFKAELGGTLQFLNCDWLSVGIDVMKLTFDLGSWHKSSEAAAFKAGACENYTYRITVFVTDEDGEAISGAAVTAADKTLSTNNKGNAVFYLTKDTHTIEATSGELTRSKSVKVDEAEKVTISLGEASEPDNSIGGILGTIDSSDVSDFINVLQQPVITLNGHTYTLFDNVAETWDEALLFCETMGGHLATITSEEENELLYNYMLNCGYSNVYWGFTDSVAEGEWQWCTGEPVEYTNWGDGQPDDNDTNPEDYGMYWSGLTGGKWNDGFFGKDSYAFFCEWDYEIIDVKATFNGHEYQIFDSIATSWEEAQAYCISLGGHLATITSQEENDFLYDYMVSFGYENAYWGLSDHVTEGVWEWCTGESVIYTNWTSGQPDNGFSGQEDYGMFWYDGPDGTWNDGYFGGDGYAFICEWDSVESAAVDRIDENAVSPNAVYPGDYGTEITDAYTLKTASFTGLVPNEQYVMLAMVSIEVDDPLASENLLFIDQAAAREDGTLVFQYVQRMPCDISYVVACGASHKNLKDAEITFPEMFADGELQVVDPLVVYDGETLIEGRDYVIVGTVDFTEAGTYTCSIRGIHNYTGLVECPYTVLGEVASGWSGATQWSLRSDGLLTVYGEGNMKNYGYNGGQPWLGKGVDVRSVVIEEGVTAVGTGAFRNLTTLESISLPQSGLSKIGEAAFYSCTALTEIDIPDTIYTIWAYTFKNCSALTSVGLPKTLIKIDQGAFEGCTSLPYIYIPGDTQIIGSWSFKGCTGLEEAEMTWADATEIREGAFKNCSALTTIHLPGGIETFGDSAFYGIGADSFTVPATVTTVGPWCFARASLTEITFEGDAPAIGEGAFNKIALTAHYPDGNATWTADVLQNYGGTVTWTAN